MGMGFPPLKKMIQYDVYTVAQLQKYNSGQCQIKKACVDVKECHRCTFPVSYTHLTLPTKA